MSNIINLRLARKRKARTDKEQAAEQNRVLFGRSKAEKVEAQKRAECEARLLDGHRRDRADEGDDG
ncbi:MAG: DUF4169 family protein [Pseudaminobacter sp.]